MTQSILAHPNSGGNRNVHLLALRPSEAAKALSISPRHLWQLTKDGEIPCVRVGNGRQW